MQTLSIGKLRGFQQCSSPSGIFACLALDHRQNLRRALGSSGRDPVSDQDLTEFKLEVTSALAGSATAVLLDPEYGAAQAVAGRVIPPKTGLVVALESTGYTGDPTARQSQVLPGWSVEKSKRIGASMVKLLVYYHPDAPTAQEIEQFVQQVAGECRRHEIGLMLEPLTYSPNAYIKMSSTQKRSAVVESARNLSPLGADLLKVEFPLQVTEAREENAWRDACSDLSAASSIPWILLSAAVDFDTYARQVKAACEAGASGIAAGRAVWQEAIALPGAERKRFLATIALERLTRLAEMCDRYAKPFMDFYSPPPLTPNWYLDSSGS